MSTDTTLDQALDAMLQRGIQDLEVIRHDIERVRRENHAAFLNVMRHLGQLRTITGSFLVEDMAAKASCKSHLAFIVSPCLL